MSVNPIVCVRDMNKSCSVQCDLSVLDRLSRNTFEVASEVAQIVSRDKIGNRPGKNPDIRFNVDSALLQRLLPKTVEQITSSPELANFAKGSLDRVSSFIQKYQLEKSHSSIMNPHKKTAAEQETEAFSFSSDLHDAYYLGNRFEKIDVEESSREISCFNYVVTKLDLCESHRKFHQKTVQEKKEWLNDDYLHFFLSEGFRYVSLPLRENDVIVYFDPEGNPSHGALVAKDTSKVRSKFGNGTSFA